MNVFGETSNSSDHIFSNDTDVKMSSVGYIFTILLSFPTNSYVIWLIVTGTGNGLGAEFFILNLSICEILICLNCFLVFLTFYCQIPLIVQNLFEGLAITGRPLFQSLICVERYLAVVHPVTFLKFRPLRYKLICSAAVWATTIVSGLFYAMSLFYPVELYFVFLILLFLILISVQTFCCVAVLRALKQSGPGERGREENHIKRRAFNLILVATVTTVIIYFPCIVLFAFFTSNMTELYINVGNFCYIVAGLVQPVLFICRVGKLNFIKCQ